MRPSDCNYNNCNHVLFSEPSVFSINFSTGLETVYGHNAVSFRGRSYSGVQLQLQLQLQFYVVTVAVTVAVVAVRRPREIKQTQLHS